MHMLLMSTAVSVQAKHETLTMREARKRKCCPIFTGTVMTFRRLHQKQVSADLPGAVTMTGKREEAARL